MIEPFLVLVSLEWLFLNISCYLYSIKYKYPIGIQTFQNIIEDGFVYVDKTDMVYALATEGKVYSKVNRKQNMDF